jgi:hypothetical protein
MATASTMCRGAQRLQEAPWPPRSAVSRSRHRKVATVSTESIASPPPSTADTESCAGCAAPLAADQRYCLECGERRTPMSSVLLGGPAASPAGAPHAESTGPPPPAAQRQPAADGAGRGNAVTVIAGVGVLLLAMGVGVLIGRSGGAKPSAAAAPQVISVASTPAAGTAASASSASSFTDDWPSGTNGYTVQLQTLPQASTQVSAVEAAKSAASAKRAKGVGALRSEDFSSLKAGDYVIYSGVYHKKAEAEKARTGLTKSFPGALVVRVSSGSASSPGANSAAGSKGAGSGSGASLGHPAPPASVEALKTTKGKSYEEQSKNLPNVISTG